MCQIVTIAGSPSQTAKSSAVLEYTQRIVRRFGAHSNAIQVGSLPADDLVHARLDCPEIQAARCLIHGAEAIIIATPVYKSAYSGILKTFLDLLPRDAFQGKTILPIAIAGSPCHLLALDNALKPVLASLSACHILRGVYITDSQIQFAHGGALELESEIDERLRSSISDLIAPFSPHPLVKPAAGPALVPLYHH